MIKKTVLNKVKLDLLGGRPIMLFDFPNRENETDLVYYGKKVKPNSIKDLRINAGAPLTVYIDYESAEKIGITTYVNLISKIKSNNFLTYKALIKNKKEMIDARFSLSFDYRNNKTGCSHYETSITIRKLAELIKKNKYNEFGRVFKSPGHVPLIISSKRLLLDRRGHSEMLIKLTRILHMLPIVIASEMIHPITLKSMNYSEAKKYARKKNIIFLEGKDLL